MKKFIIILISAFISLSSFAQVSLYAGAADLRSSSSPNYNYVCPSIGLSIDNFYIDVVGNLEKTPSTSFTQKNYNIFGGNVGYRFWISKKWNAIAKVGVISSRRIEKTWDTDIVYYCTSQHKTNWGVSVQRSLNRRFELSVGVHSIEKIRVALLYNIKVESIY